MNSLNAWLSRPITYKIGLVILLQLGMAYLTYLYGQKQYKEGMKAAFVYIQGTMDVSRHKM